ncbi:helix-turn-helix domain-containing protein [Antarcticirhabdus aurantiaca]|uniref:helix-turn-helix domain-containing protein n=1 Tax=Antarcticirhabdus aurantiaca TaxID=2606717 RepID=UPI00131B98B9|nr:helix-turn-helix domain-containing protein [Antarcticirhabdus aurantiaca]
MTIGDRILALLASAPGRFTSTAEIVSALYADRIDGGPPSAPVIVRVEVLRLRRRGHRIESRHTGGYKLARNS